MKLPDVNKIEITLNLAVLKTPQIIRLSWFYFFASSTKNYHVVHFR